MFWEHHHCQVPHDVTPDCVLLVEHASSIVNTVDVLLPLLVCAGLKVMVECRSNSRHMLTWLMDQMDAEKDSIFLAVTKAHEQGTGMVRLHYWVGCIMGSCLHQQMPTSLESVRL